jgi:hypothetical protein
LYGGGGGADSNSHNCSHGGAGVVRIMWPGSTRQFPSTNAGSP